MDERGARIEARDLARAEAELAEVQAQLAAVADPAVADNVDNPVVEDDPVVPPPLILNNNIQQPAPAIDDNVNPFAQRLAPGVLADNPNADALQNIAMILAFKRLGIKPQAAKYLVEEQDINNMLTFMELEEEQIQDLCSTCRRISKNPPYDKGYNVGVMPESNFKRASFYCKFLAMTSRTMEYSDIDVGKANSIKAFKKEIEGKTKPEEEPPKPTQSKVFEFFENFREYLDDYIGTISGRPLTYVVRPTLTIKASATDPPFGDLDSSYPTYYKEIENRAPIKTMVNNGGSMSMQPDPHYIHDNVMVWKILYGMLKGTPYLTYIKEYIPRQDGREAFKALHDHLLGTQAINTYASRAENALQNLHLDGTKKSTQWNLDKYVQAHIEQHVILEKLTKYGHNGIGEQQKILYFLKGITAPNLMTVKSSLAVTPKQTFTETSMAFKTYATAELENRRTQKQQQVTIASVNHNNGGQKGNNNGYRSRNTSNRSRSEPYDGPSRKDDKFDVNKSYSEHKLDSRYYAKEEWKKLTRGQRNYLRQNPPNKDKKKDDHKRKIAALTAKIAALETKQSYRDTPPSPSEYSDSDESEDEAPKKSKRTKRTKVSTKRR